MTIKNDIAKHIVGIYKKIKQFVLLHLNFVPTRKKTGSCDEDSGGPVFMKIKDNNIERTVLVGSVSRRDSKRYQYGVYENTTYYKTWIDEKIKNLEAGLRE